MDLMVVESPAKIKTIEGYLGENWKVVASFGHVRDLPQREMGINASDFSLEYEYIPARKVGEKTFSGGEERVSRIRALLGKADRVVIATDPDREGEAIAWHLVDALGLSEADYERVTFDEITGTALREAINRPRKINYQLVSAQEARRALDRIVGYQVSPLVSDALCGNYSAGRVQSIAVRLVVDRENQIRTFKRTDHFGAVVSFDGGDWSAEWDTKPFTSEASPYVLDRSLAQAAASCRQFRVVDSKSEDTKKAPPAPFITSTMLQAASVSLNMDPEVTTKLAQKLYEKGVITYIRTDGTKISDDALAMIRSYAQAKGLPLSEKARVFQSKAGAQEAHECIRPTKIDVEEAGENDDQKRLYRLIRERALACQLDDARYKVNTLVLEATDGVKPFQFVAKGRQLIALGWRSLTADDATEDKAEADQEEGGTVPLLDRGATKTADSGEVKAKATKPPSRYTKASLVKKMEADGIGRPSTFAPILMNVLGRGYLDMDKRHIVPTEIGFSVIDLLSKKAGFGFMDYEFTREMESQLDGVALGNIEYLDIVAPYHEQLQSELSRVKASPEFKPRHACNKCGSSVRRVAKPGKIPFWVCSSDECKNIMDDREGKPVERQRHECPECKSELRRYRQSGGGIGWFCTNDECKTFLDDEDGRPVPKKVYACPNCKGPLRRYQKKDKETKKPIKGAFGWFCPADNCDTFIDDKGGKPVSTPKADCPKCGRPMYRRKGQYGFWWGCSGYHQGCKHTMHDLKGKPVEKRAK